jgi:ribosomal protein S18 acetylase RimI-like enzyme
VERETDEGRFLQLEDLYVKPEARNMGVGKALFAELGAIAQEKVSLPPTPTLLRFSTNSLS